MAVLLRLLRDQSPRLPFPTPFKTHPPPTQGAGGEPRLWELRLHCDKDYPRTAPQISFKSKIVLECVDARGAVAAAKVPYLASWNGAKTMHGALTDIKTLINRASRSQPPDGASF